ncbi:MAG: hypothetical protein WCG79_01590 [Verrucomicrobiota bacterium]|jgi:hypothetical protein
MNIASEMQTLCDKIVSTSVNRANRLDSLRHETNTLRRDTRRMTQGFHESFATMARGLHATLRSEADTRKKTVAGLRSRFQKNSRAVRADLVAAKGIWAAMAKGS